MTLMTNSFDGVLQLLVIQGSPFCNLNCRYCYLPDRQNKARMAFETMRASLENALSSRMVGKELTIVWHAGEPLALPIAYYEKAFALVQTVNRGRVKITHSVQTNGTTLNAAWCEFLKQHDVRVGVSIDGPQDLHDHNRIDWKGNGSHERVMRGVRLLQQHDISFHVISVVSRAAMLLAEDMFRFYVDAGIRSVGFNVEEQEGANLVNHIDGEEVRAQYRHFLQRFLELNLAADCPLTVREFDSMLGAICFGTDAMRAQDNAPFRIVSVDWQGNFSTWSPEMLGLEHAAYGDFVLGNLTRDQLDDIALTQKFRALNDDIETGIRACREQCSFFRLCGGGCPSNKLAEHGTFKATTTAHCALTKRTVAEVVLGETERALLIV